MRVVRCATLVHDKTTKSNVYTTAQTGLLLGYDEHESYTVKLLSSNQTVNLVHVTLDEILFPGSEDTDSSSGGEKGKWTKERINDKKYGKSSNESNDSDVVPIEFENTHLSFESEFETTSTRNEALSNIEPCKCRSTRE